jgi:hypothetical protein
LNVHVISNDLVNNGSEEWRAYLEVTEEKVDLLQTHIDFKRAELEAAAKENESFTTRILEVRSSLCRLQQNMSSPHR